jgi:4-carboxymuconolactone decarboxylase
VTRPGGGRGGRRRSATKEGAAPQPKGAGAEPASRSVPTTLDGPTRGLVRIALGVPAASEARLAEWMRAALDAGTPSIWLEELLIASVLYVGFPRALVGMTVFRRLVPEPEVPAEVEGYAMWPQWQARGEATCRVVYGKHYDQLRHNIRQLHPALDQWMVVDGYGKTLSRPGLDLMRRELCSVALLVPQTAPRQLVAHLRGALNAGATRRELDDVLALAVEAGLDAGALEVARELWHELRDSFLHD